MRLARNSVTFEGFIWYLSGGFYVFLIGCIVSLFIGILIWSNVMEKTKTESDFYAVFRGQEIKDEKIRKIKDFLVDYEKGNVGSEELKAFVINISDIETNQKSVLKEKWDNIQLILRNTPGSENIKVRVATWSEFFIVFGLIAWLFVNFCFLVSYLCGSNESRSDRSESILTYPWKKLWSYPFIPVMIFFLLVSQPILLVLYMINRVRPPVALVEEQVRQRPQSVQARIRPQYEIDDDREKFMKMVESAKRKKSAARREWLAICSQRLALMKGEVEEEIKRRRAALSDFGLEIEKYQRLLAEAQAKLKDIEKAMQTKTSDQELGLDFDRFSAIPEILAITIKKGEIIVYTDTLFIDYDGIRYELGNYLLRIPTAGGQFIKVENQCNTSNCGSHHPYTYPAGSNDICFGKLAQYISELLKKREYFALVVVLMQALQSSDGDRPEKTKMWKEAALPDAR